MELSDLRPAGERISQSFKNLSQGALAIADAMSNLANVLRGPQPDLPEVGEYIRITNEHDLNFGEIGEVLDVEGKGVPGSPVRYTVHFLLNPFGDGGEVKFRRPIDIGCFEILNCMEVLAEAAR